MTFVPLAVCPRCQHLRVRAQPSLFGVSELQNPGVLKARLEWDQQNQERRQAEQQRFDAGQPFNYEPHHYPWCAAASPSDNTLPEAIYNANDPNEAKALARQSVERGRELVRRAEDGDWDALEELAQHGRATMNPVTGEVAPIYTLCAHLNPTGQCPLFEPKKRAEAPR